MQFILTVGLPASGKSTWAKRYVRYNPGTMRFNNDEFSHMTTGWDDGRSFEPMDAGYLRTMRTMAISRAARKGIDLVLDNTNLNPRVERELDVFLSEGNTLRRVNFQIDYATCIQRNNMRGNPIPNSVIENMAKKYNDRYDWIDYEGIGSRRHTR